MTRINAGIPPSELHQRHLVAELREITMVPAALRRSLRTRDPRDILRGIPEEFTLNRGHVTFFYNKLGYLQDRFHELVCEMNNRGYNPDVSRVVAFDGFSPEWYGSWKARPSDNNLVRTRIRKRISEKPHLYVNKSHS